MHFPGSLIILLPSVNGVHAPGLCARVAWDFLELFTSHGKISNKTIPITNC